MTTLLNEIISFLFGRKYYALFCRKYYALFGRKYYANIVCTRGVEKYEICSLIFPTKEAAMEHKRTIETTLSFQFIETISFRSRFNYMNR